MDRAKNWLSRAIVVITLGSAGGFLVGGLTAGLAISFHAVVRSESPIWSLGDLYFALAIAAVVGIPVGVIAFTLAYVTVLQRRIDARELSTLAISTVIGGIAGAAIVLPLAIFTAPLGFFLSCIFLSERERAAR
ncbi:MAG TPA: hypothetical protein VF613_05805 [Longimicrobium sp.]|jgi:hypothetical protein